MVLHLTPLPTLKHCCCLLIQKHPDISRHLLQFWDLFYAQQQNICMAKVHHLIRSSAPRRGRAKNGNTFLSRVCLHECVYVSERKTGLVAMCECLVGIPGWFVVECGFPQFLSELWSQKTGLLKWNTSFPHTISSLHRHTAFFILSLRCSLSSV